MNKRNLEVFLLTARTQTYASATGQSKPLLPKSVQYEYQAEEYLYRDIYYIGNGIFPGIETVFYKSRPVWSMSYFGDFSSMTEEQADTLLRQALIDMWDQTRMYSIVKKDYGDWRYVCEGRGTINKLSGAEKIYVNNEPVYRFYYKGGFIG